MGPLQWGGFSIVTTILAALRTAAAQGASEWFLVLSGQDYPLRHPAQIAHDLAACSYDGYLRVGAVFPSAARTWRRMDRAERRYFYRYRSVGTPDSKPGPLRRAATGVALRLSELQPLVDYVATPAGLPDRAGVRRLKVPFSAAFRCYRGWQWLTLSRRAVESLLRTASARPDLLEYYSHTWIPDESFFHTLLLNDDSLDIYPESDRFMRWPETNREHPVTLRLGDLPDLFRSSARFARKFDSGIDAVILDELDARIS